MIHSDGSALEDARQLHDAFDQYVVPVASPRMEVPMNEDEMRNAPHMAELANAVAANAGRASVDQLQAAAKKWVDESMSTYTDELLFRALEVGRAIAQFTAELDAPSGPQRRPGSRL